MNDPTPDTSPGDELLQILEDYRRQYINADLGTLNDDVQAIEADNAKLRAKDRLNRLMLTARIEELERAKERTEMDRLENGYAVPYEYISKRIKAIDAQLNKEEI